MYRCQFKHPSFSAPSLPCPPLKINNITFGFEETVNHLNETADGRTVGTEWGSPFEIYQKCVLGEPHFRIPRLSSPPLPLKNENKCLMQEKKKDMSLTLLQNK
uniref:Uncharacterized protein n=1 Tax=Sphaerodactylus townsendi TaxID=933632 RepID=A0ACB8FJK9_9SAUR